ncbi:MAG: hypothetical protein FJ137_00830 [Deltaproteobacteria bacterium]|nr:hypothetical protein [Deltaproteobacteria bacterium]
MRSLPFPRRLQLVKLLRAHGLRDVERLREDELKDALTKLSVLLPDLQRQPPPASMSGAAHAPPEAVSTATTTPPPVIDDDENAWCLPRFREPRLFVPEGERTFLRLVAVKPRLLFFTWELGRDVERTQHARLEIALREFLGEAPSRDALLEQTASLYVDVDLRSSGGWYVEVPAERYAVVARLVQAGRVVATSNLALTPPARPAPPGPLWRATLAPTIERSALRGGGLLRPEALPEGAQLETVGEVLPEPVAIEVVVPLPSSGEHRFKFTSPAASPEREAPSSSSLPSRSQAPVIGAMVSGKQVARPGFDGVPGAPSSSTMPLAPSSAGPSSSAVAAGRKS